MDEADGQGQELRGRQGPGLNPIGQALRATYDAENHDTLGKDLTGLMLQLARVETDEPRPSDEKARPAQAVAPPPVAPPAAPPLSWVRRLLDRMLVDPGDRREAG